MILILVICFVVGIVLGYLLYRLAIDNTNVHDNTGSDSILNRGTIDLISNSKITGSSSTGINSIKADSSDTAHIGRIVNTEISNNKGYGINSFKSDIDELDGSIYNLLETFTRLLKEFLNKRNFMFVKIDPYIISHPANCEIMQHSQNSSKFNKCSITIEDLLKNIKIWNEKYGEYENKINYEVFKNLNIVFNIAY